MIIWQVAVAALLGGALGYGGGRLAPRWLEERPLRPWEPYLLAGVNGAVCALLAAAHPFGAYFWQQFVFISVLTTVSLIDLHDRIIPNEMVLAGLVAGLIMLALLPYPEKGWLEGVGGAAGAFAALLVIALIAPGGMGLGDVKLAAVIGLFLGRWSAMGLLFAFLAGGLVSSLLLALRIVGRKSHIPFGPWLALGAIVAAIYGPTIWNWYMTSL
ncbi:MAG TPA: A24 family peptidase [Symbiobacteriaceae bacterium]|nr:A24 family peptidase [Symbiobacteriaceae bacterium]